MDYLINMSCIGAVLNCFISAGLVLGQKWAVVSVGLILGAVVDFIISVGLVSRQTLTVSYQ